MRQPGAVAACYENLFALHRSGQVRPVLADVVGLEEVPAALTALADRRTIGKLVVDLARSS
jgi:NADPH2:quinone reductase